MLEEIKGKGSAKYMDECEQTLSVSDRNNNV